MKRYMRCKTTMGHTYYMRRCEDEIQERKLFHIALVALPFLASVLMMAVWLGR